MAKLDVSRRELERAWRHLRQHSEGELTEPAAGRVAAAKVLLGLYAVECGLKLLLLDRRQVHHTSQLDSDDDFYTHDLNALLQQLGQPPRFRHSVAAQPKGVRVAPVRLHELYRYGGLLCSTEESSLCASVLELFGFVEDNAA